MARTTPTVLLLSSALLLSACAIRGTGSAPPTALSYPAAKTDATVDEYHGASVADPYRGLEEYSDETNKWIDAQEALARKYLDAIPQRTAIKDLLSRLWNFEKFGLPEQAGGRYFYTRNDGLQNQSVLYVAEGLRGNPRTLLDPNALAKDGTVALAGIFPTDNGKLLAYALADAGSDWNTIKVRDVATGKDLADEIRWVKFSPAAWTKDGKGFYYCRFDAPKGEALKAVNEYHKVYWHTVGTTQAEDPLVYERKDQPKWYLGPQVSDDGRWLIMGVEDGDSVNNALFYKDLSKTGSAFVELFNKFDAKYNYIGNDGTVFYIRSDLDAPHGRVWAVDVAKPDRANWREMIPQGADALTSASIVGDRLFCNYLHDARSLVRVHGLDGKLVGDVKLPGICTASGFGGRRDDTETFFSVGGFTLPPTVWHYDLATGATEVFKSPKVPFDGSKYETVQVFATSKDGARVPMFITQRKGVALDGSNPTLLYGYGGFNVSITPDFTAVQAAWLEMGGVYVEATLRGGGEYGEDWHRAGMRLTKQNVFDDFIAAAEWLIANRYTSSAKLAIQGASNGGLLVGACETQRPELFGACLPAVGVLDMLRFQKFTIGWGWVGDYGTSETKDEFPVLYSYSPYHRALRDSSKKICYPPTLITTGDHDDRVYPAHSFKFAAALQQAQACANPILLRIEKRAGHGAGKPTSKRIEENADIYAFLAKTFNMDVR